MKSEIWWYSKGFYKIYTEDYQEKEKIDSWQSCRCSNTYYDQYGKNKAWDLIFPSRLYNRVAKVIGAPPRKKNPLRVK